MKDLRLLKKATALFPRLNEKEIAVAETVSITRDGKGIKKKSLRDFRTMSLKKGDEVIVPASLTFADIWLDIFLLILRT